MGVMDILDITVVAIVLYGVYFILKDTKAVDILKGVSIILVLWVLSLTLRLSTLDFVLSQVLSYGVLGFIILFQPELRTTFEKIGKKSVFKTSTYTESQYVIGTLVDSVTELSSTKTGALICIEMNDSLSEYASTGVDLDAKLSKSLLGTIFFINTPLHDGAVFIKGTRLVSASGYLPLTERQDIPKELGTRHRSGIGLTEVTDSIVLIVSEETGLISCIRYGEITRGLTKDDLRTQLEKYLVPKKADKNKKRK